MGDLMYPTMDDGGCYMIFFFVWVGSRAKGDFFFFLGASRISQFGLFLGKDCPLSISNSSNSNLDYNL